MHDSVDLKFFPVVGGVAQQSKIGIHTNSGGNKKNNKPNDDIRRGKWTQEEESYAIKLIEAFNAGLLDLPEEEVATGLTLRAFLALRLSCDPMRITKKFSGDYCLGKRNYHNTENPNPEQLENVKTALRQLEHSFRMKDVEVKKEKMNREEIERNKLHPVMDYDHMISSPAIDAMVMKAPSQTPVVNSVITPNPFQAADIVPKSSISTPQMDNQFVSSLASFNNEHEVAPPTFPAFIPTTSNNNFGYFYDVQVQVQQIPQPISQPHILLPTHMNHMISSQYNLKPIPIPNALSNNENQYLASLSANNNNNFSTPLNPITNNYMTNTSNITTLNGYNHDLHQHQQLEQHQQQHSLMMDTEFTNGYGNIDIPFEIPSSLSHSSHEHQQIILTTTSSNIEQKHHDVIDHNGNNRTISSEFNFSMTDFPSFSNFSSFGNIPSSTSLTGFEFSSNSLTGVLNSFIEDDDFNVKPMTTDYSLPSQHNHNNDNNSIDNSNMNISNNYMNKSIDIKVEQTGLLSGGPHNDDNNMNDLSLKLSRSVSITGDLGSVHNSQKMENMQPCNQDNKDRSRRYNDNNNYNSTTSIIDSRTSSAAVIFPEENGNNNDHKKSSLWFPALTTLGNASAIATATSSQQSSTPSESESETSSNYSTSSTSNRPYYVEQDAFPRVRLPSSQSGTSSGKFTFFATATTSLEASSLHDGVKCTTEGSIESYSGSEKVNRTACFSSSSSVKRNRSENEWKQWEALALPLSSPNASASDRQLIIPTKIRRTSSASALQNNAHQSDNNNRKSLTLSIRVHSSLFRRKAVSCSALFELIHESSLQSQYFQDVHDHSKKILRSKSHNIVVLPHHSLYEEDEDRDLDGDNHSPNDPYQLHQEPAAAICI